MPGLRIQFPRSREEHSPIVAVWVATGPLGDMTGDEEKPVSLIDTTFSRRTPWRC